MFKIRDKRNKGWYYKDNIWVDKVAKHTKPVGSAVYDSLCRHANDKQKCFPGEELIAQEQGISERSVREGIKKLEKYNIILVERGKDPKTKQYKNNVYTLLDKSVWNIPPEISAYGEPEAKYAKSRRQNMPDKDTKNAKDTKSKSFKKLNNELQEILTEFKKINPDLEANDEEVRIITNLCREHTPSYILELTKFIAGKKTDRGFPKFCPTIYTISDLKYKLAKIKDYYAKNKPSKGPVFAGR